MISKNSVLTKLIGKKIVIHMKDVGYELEPYWTSDRDVYSVIDEVGSDAIILKTYLNETHTSTRCISISAIAVIYMEYFSKGKQVY
jgi:hypothetical protein